MTRCTQLHVHHFRTDTMTSPIKPNRPTSHRTAWSDGEDDRLESLIRAGKLIREVAHALGRTESAVKKRMGKIGLRVSDPRESHPRRANRAPQVLASRAIRSGVVQHTPSGLIHLCGDDDVRC